MPVSPNPQSPTESDLASSTLNTRPVSYISSHMTDIPSEDGDTRPQSPPAWSQRSPSRRRPLARHSLSAASNQGSGPPLSTGNRMSRTHVPSLTSHAFFRPMSSQRLQMQRSGRPPTGTTQVFASEDGQSDAATQPRRSLISNSTVRPGLSGLDYELPPPSRGTEFTDPMFLDRGTSTASPTGNTTVRSGGDSVRLLHDRSRGVAPLHLNLGINHKQNGLQEPPQRSPLSFRSGFLKKTEHPERTGSRRHERLSSAASSPASNGLKSEKPLPQVYLGKNYEYWTGNTIFWGGGRLQNARDRPVNIATGIFVALPAALFFAYSYVLSLRHRLYCPIANNYRAPWLWHNVSPAIPILFAYVFFLCISSFLHASLVDPGVCCD